VSARLPAYRQSRVCVVGTFDVDNYGDHLFPRIAALELGRRIPGITVDCYSPFGRLHPTRFGSDARPLGPWRDDRLDRFADVYDAFIVGGGELLHLNDPLLGAFYGVSPREIELVQPSRWFLEGLGGGAREERCPVLWNALGVPYDLSSAQASRMREAMSGRAPAVVRDPLSKSRLEAAGVLPPIDVVPDTGLLVDRLLPVLSPAGGALAPPRGDRTVVVQGCDLVVPFVAQLAAAVVRTGLDPVLVETGRCRGDGLFADAMAIELRAAGLSPRRLPSEATLADIATTLASAELVLASSLHAGITALVHGRRFVVLNLGDESKLRGFGLVTGCEDRVVSDAAAVDAAASLPPVPMERVRQLQARVDVHFDALASAIVESVERRIPDERRAVTADDLEPDALRSHVEVLRAELAATEDELARLRATKTFRYLAPVRSVVAGVRNRRRVAERPVPE
jgi:polysaccharide pyruvyl transferase WcaK-like protein